jgi:hypothetical protein
MHRDPNARQWTALILLAATCALIFGVAALATVPAAPATPIFRTTSTAMAVAR